MARKPISRKLTNTRLANTYGGWIYCENCGKNIGYLCYVTYDSFQFEYQCKCGGHGNIHLAFKDVSCTNKMEGELQIIKNRFSCPKDQSPLFTILEKNLDSYWFEVVCSKCNTKFNKEKVL